MNRFIGEKQRAESVQARAAQEKPKSEKLFRHLLDNCTDVIFFLDDDCHVVCCSQSFLDLSGICDMSEVEGRHFIDFVARFDPEHRASVAETLSRAMREKKKSSLSFRSRIAGPGRILDLHMKIAPLLSPSGAIDGFGVSCQDVTAFLAEKEKSDEANRMKTNFIATLGHEIRTPMNAVLGLSETAIDKAVSEEVRESLIAINRAGGNLLSLVNDLLGVSAVESGRLELSERSYSLSTLVGDVFSMMRRKPDESGVEFIVDVDCALPERLFGDAVKLRQILLNLLSNAFKYTREGRVVLSVSGTRPEAGVVELVFQVRDTGVGIGEADCARLFDYFVRLDRERNGGVDGVGVGLAISRELAKVLGGSIEVESEYGRGSVFTVTVRQREEGAAPLSGTAAAVEPMRALVCEPRALYRGNLLTALGNLGFACDSAESAEALLSLCGNDYDVVFAAPWLMETVADRFAGRREPPRAIALAGPGELDLRKTAPFVLAVPTHCLAVAAFLRGEKETPVAECAPFTAPSARVLVVDDVAANRVVAQRLLAPYRIAVDLCADGGEAVALAAGSDYDMVLMDTVMPGMDGFEAVARIRGAPGGKRPPVVAVTANAELASRAVQGGFDDFLLKPLDREAVEKTLRRWLPAAKRVPARPSPVAGFDADDAEGCGAPREVLVAFVDNVPRVLKKMRHRLSRLDEPGAMSAYAVYAHGLCGSCRSVRAEAAALMAERLERAAREGKAAEIRVRHRRFETCLRGLSIAIRDHLTAFV